MRRFEFRKFFVASALVLGLSAAASPAFAQQDPNYGGAQPTQMDDEDGMDWGWLGLLGLAGLLGLRRRDRHDHVDHVNTTTRRDRV